MRPDRAVTVVLVAALLGAAAQYLFVRERAGLNVPVATAIFLAAAWRTSARAPRRGDLWLPMGALVFASLCAIRTDAPLVGFDALAATSLAIGTVIALRGVAITDLPLVALVREGVDAAGAATAHMASALPLAWPGLRATLPSRTSRVNGYAGGILLAAPLLVVFAALFASADAIFQRTITDVLDLARLRELLADVPARVTVATLAAWAAGGLLAWTSAPRDGPGRGAVPRLLGSDAVTGMLLAIDALFAFFVVLQIAYLFGGRSTLDAAGISYSAYARRGFFELVAVVSIVGGLLFVSDLIVRGGGRAYRAAAVALVALCGAVLASAAMRMDLYQAAYGWTELRFYACLGIAYLALGLAILAWAITRSRMEIALQRLVIAGLAVALAANAIGPSGLIARANIERVTSPEPLPEDSYRDVDLGYLISLGDGAIPALADSLPRLPVPERAKLDDLLRFVASHRPAPGGWQSWDLDRTRAEALLVR
jgi:Domain of unknown function (DUF4173)